MKKRILSMLLLVAMIVTALPLFALPTLAAEEEKVYEEADYNKLFVQDNLVFGVDFYNTNKYWNEGEGKTVSGSYDVTGAKTLLNGYLYAGHATTFNVTYASGTTNTVTIKDGYLDLHPFYYLSPHALNLKINNGENGATSEIVRTWVSTAKVAHLMGIRINAPLAGGAATSYVNANGGTLFSSAADFKANNVLGTDVVYTDASAVATYTTVMRRPEATNGNLDTRISKETTLYTLGSYTPEGGAEGTMIDLGAEVITSSTATLCRQYPFKTIVPDYVKQADGTVIENTAGTEYYYALPRIMYGEAALYQNGNKLFASAENAFPYVNNAFHNDDTYIVLWGESGSSVAADKEAGKLYAARYYADKLTDAEIAQNHFADLAKWFRIDLSPLDAISVEDIVTIAPAFKDFTVESDKAAVEATLTAKVAEIVTEKYAGTVASAYAALAAEYALDLSPLLKNPKGMFPRTYSYLNSLLAATETVVGAKATYEEKLAADYAAIWDSFGWGYDDYNTLYAATDADVLSLDFFNTNAIWGQKNELPTAPSANTNYLYAGETYDFTKAEDRLVEADENYAVLRSDGSFVYRNKNGGMALGYANYPQTPGVTNDWTQHMPRQTFTKEDADKVAVEAKAAWPGFEYSVVAVDLWMIWRTDSAGKGAYYTTAGKWSARSYTKEVKLYASEAATLTAIEGLKQDGYTYEAIVRPLASAAYYQCITDYAADVVKYNLYALDTDGRPNENGNIDRTGRLTFTQNMTTVGEVSYQSQTGLDHMYSHVTFHDGYMELDPEHSGPYFSWSGIKATGDYYLDAVMAGGDKALAGTALTNGAKVFVFRNQEFRFAVDGTGTKLLTVGGKATAENGVSGQLTPFRLNVASKDLGSSKVTMQTAINGEEVLGSDVTVTPTTNGLIGHGQPSEMRFYTLRVYNRILSAEEQAQNHFADIAKFFKLNLSGFEALDAEGKAAVYAAVADINFDATRTEAQNAVNAVLNAKVDAEYEALKTEYPTVSASFIDLAREYRLDLTEVLASDRAVDAVYATSFDGLSFADAQEKLNDAYHDAYYFYIYQKAGREAWNAWLAAVAAENKVQDIEDLAVLPQAVREGILGVSDNDDPAVIADYAAEKLNAYITTDEATYNALYVQDKLVFAADFFGTNEYWNRKYELPLAPSDNAAYEYEGETYNFADGVADSEKTAFAAAKTEWQTAYRNYMNSTFRWTTGNMKFGVFGSSGVTQERAPFYLTDEGYAQFHANYSSSGGMVFSGIPSSTASTAQLVLSLGYHSESGYSGTPLLFHNIRAGVKVLKDQVYFSGMNGDSAMGAVYLAQKTDVATGEKTEYARYTSLQGASRTAIAEDAEAYAATLNASAAEGEVYSCEKINVNQYKIYKTVGGTKTHIATFDLKSLIDPDYTFTPDPDVVYAYDEVFGITESVELKDGNDFFSVRTEDGLVGSLEAPYNNGAAKLDASTHYIGWGSAHKHMRMYAFRQYERVLSDAELLQNHFADLAKFYRLDLAGYTALSEDAKAGVHEAFRGYELGAAERDALAAKLVEMTYAADYEAAEAVLSADMMAIVRELGLEVSGLVNANADARAYAEATVLADFEVGMPMNTYVVQAVIDQAILYKNAFAFEGVQVRLHSDTAGDIPGVRAIFSANRSVLESYAALGRKVAFGVEICDVNGNALSELYFYTNDEGAYAGTNTVLADGKTVDAIIREVGDNSLAFAYTVIFDTTATQTAEYYGIEFAYRFFLEVDGVRNVQDAVVSESFGKTVSAAEVYEYFSRMDGFADDAVVTMVTNAVNAAE